MKIVFLCKDCSNNYFLENKLIFSNTHEDCYKCGKKINTEIEECSIFNKDEVDRIDYDNSVQGLKGNIAMVLAVVIILGFVFMLVKEC